MDFINHQLKRLNPPHHDKLGFISQVPTLPQNEIEQLNNDIFKSIKMRTQNIIDNPNNQETFEKMVNQMHGQDISNITDLTKEFEKKTRRNS
jgi:16S rRNA C1402 (ribose-2'-O) methylase RsmI